MLLKLEAYEKLQEWSALKIEEYNIAKSRETLTNVNNNHISILIWTPLTDSLRVHVAELPHEKCH